MATNGMSVAAEPRLEEETSGIQMDPGQPAGPAARRRVFDRSADVADPAETADDFALAPLVDKIAFGIARGLVVAMKELENHIATETRKVGVAVDRRLVTLQSSLAELSAFVKEQRSTNLAVQDRLQQLTAAAESLREVDAGQSVELDTLRAEARGFSSSVTQRIDTSTAALRESEARHSSGIDALRTETRAFSSSVSERIDVAVTALKEADERQATDLAALRVETRASTQSIAERLDNLCREVSVQQEDVAAIKTTLSSVCSRIDAFVDRLDRQADAVRLMHTNYSQRETELEQIVDGLARLRAFPRPLPANGL